MIRALFFDLDGTLLTSEKRLLPSSRAALCRCREKGIRVFFATARSPKLDKMLGWTEEEFSLFDGGIYCNGAIVRIGGLEQTARIDARAVRAAVREASRLPGVHIAVNLEDGRYAFNHALDDAMLIPWGLERGQITGLDAAQEADAVKVLIYTRSLVDADELLPETLYGAIRLRCEGLANVYLTDQGRSIQLTALGADKRSAIARVCDALSLSMEETAVFGDDLNDMEMLSACANGVAMGNAHEQVKAIAAHITRSCDEDGIAWALERLLRVI